jgi:hypothetical protein
VPEGGGKQALLLKCAVGMIGAKAPDQKSQSFFAAFCSQKVVVMTGVGTTIRKTHSFAKNLSLL